MMEVGGIAFSTLASFLATSLVIEMTPGPNMTYLALVSATGSLLGANWIHEVGLALAMIMGAISLGRGIMEHGYSMPSAVGGLGLGVMAGALGRLAIAVDLGGEVVANDVDFVLFRPPTAGVGGTRSELLGEPDGEVLGAAAGRVEVFNDKGEFHEWGAPPAQEASAAW